MNKKIVASVIYTGLLLAMLVIVLGVPFVFSQGGCPPNENCPPRTIPVPHECTSGDCEYEEPSGYCIICEWY